MRKLSSEHCPLVTYFPDRNGYPSLLIVNGQRHLSCNNLNNLPADKLNKTSYQVKLGTEHQL